MDVCVPLMFMPSSFVGQPTTESILKQIFLPGNLAIAWKKPNLVFREGFQCWYLLFITWSLYISTWQFLVGWFFSMRSIYLHGAVCWGECLGVLQRVSQSPGSRVMCLTEVREGALGWAGCLICVAQVQCCCCNCTTAFPQCNEKEGMLAYYLVIKKFI